MTQVDTNPNTANELTLQYVAALGGIDNIQEIDACITRLRVGLKALNVINEVDLKKLGAMGVVKLGDNKLQIIVGPKADCIVQQIKTLK